MTFVTQIATSFCDLLHALVDAFTRTELKGLVAGLTHGELSRGLSSRDDRHSDLRTELSH